MYSANEATYTISWLLSEKFNEAGDDGGSWECRSVGERGLLPAETVAAVEETGGIGEANKESLQLANMGVVGTYPLGLLCCVGSEDGEEKGEWVSVQVSKMFVDEGAGEGGVSGGSGGGCSTSAWGLRVGGGGDPASESKMYEYSCE